MKKIYTIALSALLALAVTACGASSSTPDSESVPQVEAKNYTQILLDVRDEESNKYNPIIGRGEDGTFTFTHNPNEIDPSIITDNIDMTLSIIGVTDEQIEDIALSTSLMNVQAYCVAIVKPTAGNEAAVTEAINAYLAAQQQSFEAYLPAQYEITKSARIETLATGELVFVMCQDADTVFEAIKTAIEA